MSEQFRGEHEQDSKHVDATRLASLIYYSLDREVKCRQGESMVDAETELRGVIGDIQSYIHYRAQQDSEMGQEILQSLESFRDPDPTLATLEAAQDMQKFANKVRQTLGLHTHELPTDLPPGDHSAESE